MIVPNRILREGILTSERVNRLKDQAELFYRRLMSVVDDFGRFDGRPDLLRVVCYPLKVDCVRVADISRLLAEVQEAGLVVLYEIDGKSYIELQDFRQQVRATTSKYPARATQVLVNGCAEASPPHTKTETYSESDAKSKTETNARAGTSLSFLEIMPNRMRECAVAVLAWEGYVRDRADRGKPVNCNQARAQFGAMEEWTLEEIVAGLKNAVLSNHSRPFRPDAPKNNKDAPLRRANPPEVTK